MPDPKPSTTQRPPGGSSSRLPGGHATDRSLVAVGVGLAATGLGALIGLATERAAVARRIRPEAGMPRDDGRGGPPLGSLRGEPRIVISREIPLHMEVDEPEEPYRKGDLTIVFSHGYALTLDSWHYQRLALRGRYRLVFWDQRGHGRSGTGPVGSSTIDQVGEDLGAVIDAVAPAGPLLLLGHSMGGMTVMSLAAQRPELFEKRVVGVGLISTSAGGTTGVDLGLSGLGRLGMMVAPAAARVLARQPKLVARSRQIGSDLESLLVRRYSFASPVPPQLVAFASRMIARTRLEVISDFLPTFTTHDKREALAAMSGSEVLVLVGDSDLLTPSTESEEIVQLLPAAEHVVVTHAGHLLPLEHPDLVNGHIDELIEHALVIAKASQRRGWRRGWARRRTVTPVRERTSRRRQA
jgi:pimeloyl-ACP methyl ester carboxylesterase